MRTSAIGMNLSDHTVLTHRFDLDADQLLALQLGKKPVQSPGFRPAIHARVDRMPVAKSLRQCSPLAAVFRDKQNRIDHVEILMRDVAALSGQVRLNSCVLIGCDFDPHGISRSVNTP